MHVLITGERQIGKTTVLQKVIGQSDRIAGGIICPIDKIQEIGGKSMTFFSATEKDTLSVGRFHIRKQAIEFGKKALQQAMHKPGYIVFDEVGPLELHQKNGFINELETALKIKECLIVIRKKMLEQFQNTYPAKYKIFEIRENNRDTLAQEITEWLHSQDNH